MCEQLAREHQGVKNIKNGPSNVFQLIKTTVFAVCVCVQVSQYTFAMCSYRERKADPTEMLQLDGFTVDYCEPLEGWLICVFLVKHKLLQ